MASILSNSKGWGPTKVAYIKVYCSFDSTTVLRLRFINTLKLSFYGVPVFEFSYFYTKYVQEASYRKKDYWNKFLFMPGKRDNWPS